MFGGVHSIRPGSSSEFSNVSRAEKPAEEVPKSDYAVAIEVLQPYIEAGDPSEFATAVSGFLKQKLEEAYFLHSEDPAKRNSTIRDTNLVLESIVGEVQPKLQCDSYEFISRRTLSEFAVMIAFSELAVNIRGEKDGYPTYYPTMEQAQDGISCIVDLGDTFEKRYLAVQVMYYFPDNRLEDAVGSPDILFPLPNIDGSATIYSALEKVNTNPWPVERRARDFFDTCQKYENVLPAVVVLTAPFENRVIRRFDLYNVGSSEEVEPAFDPKSGVPSSNMVKQLKRELDRKVLEV